jgi:hypothetical protein
MLHIFDFPFQTILSTYLSIVPFASVGLYRFVWIYWFPEKEGDGLISDDKRERMHSIVPVVESFKIFDRSELKELDT